MIEEIGDACTKRQAKTLLLFFRFPTWVDNRAEDESFRQVEIDIEETGAAPKVARNNFIARSWVGIEGAIARSYRFRIIWRREGRAIGKTRVGVIVLPGRDVEWPPGRSPDKWIELPIMRKHQ